MRIPRQYNFAGVTPSIGAGALYIRVKNVGAGPVGILFTGADIANKIMMLANETLEFPLFTTGYAGFTLDNGAGGPVASVQLIIIN